MRITAICPTYNRTHLLPNVLAMFHAQTHVDKRLIILDDAGQVASQSMPGVNIISHRTRFGTLGAKFDYLVRAAIHDDPMGGIVLFEDDDVYLPQYMELHAEMLEAGRVSMPRRKMANDGVGFGKWHYTENTHHGCWGFLPAHYAVCGGYDVTKSEGFDTDFCGRLQQCGTSDPWPEPEIPQYIYRWFTASKNGSAFGAGIMESQGLPEKVRVGRIVGEFDEETERYYREFGFQATN